MSTWKVLSGRGVGLAPESASRYYNRPGIAYVPAHDAEPSVVALAWLDRPDVLSPAAATFLDFARLG